VRLFVRWRHSSYATSDEPRGKEKGSGQPATNRSKQAGMGKKVVGFLLASLVLVSVRLAEAQQPKKIPRIGFLCAPSPVTVSARIEAFRRGLRELGYIEGQNVVVEYRYAEGKLDRLPDLAAELVRLPVDVIVAAGGMQAFRAAKNATNMIPIVVTGAGDPVGNGLIASLAQPGGNLTGLSLGGNELYGKRLELLKEAVPKTSRVVFFWYRSSEAVPSLLNDIQTPAKALGLQLQSIEVLNRNDFDDPFRAAVKWEAHGLMVSIHPVFIGNRKQFLDFAAKNRLAAIYYATEFVEDGGLMSYAPPVADLWRRAATYVDKILKGRAPSDLPVEQPLKFEFIINLKAAKQIGLTIPPNVLVRADKVIK
jgi:putative tryptophan/tyrosine transport system substrate-binding protein